MSFRTNHRTRRPFRVWRGPAWRSDTGFSHDPGQTANDIVNFEADELGNEDIRKQALATGLNLSNIPARDVFWVTRSKRVAENYGDPEPRNIKGYAILAYDTDGGYLVAKI